MKKVPFYLCFFLLSTLTVFGQKQADAETKKTIENYESQISKSLSASDYDAVFDNYKKIIKLYEKKGLSKSELATYYAKAGRVAYELEHHKKALKYQQQAIKIQEKSLESIDLVTSYRDIVKTCKAFGQYQKAAKYQKQVILILEDELDAQHPDLAIAYGEVGKLYESARKYQLSLEYFEEAAAMLDGSEQYKAELDYYQEAITFLERQLAEREETGYFTQYSREEGAVSDISLALSILYLEKNYTEALARFNELNARSETAENWECIGLCYYYLGDYPKAIEAYQKAVVLSPEIKQVHYYNNIGAAYAKNGQFEEAEIAFEAYEALLPNDYWHYRNMGMLYALQNEKDKAMEQLRKAIESGYSDVEWLETDDSMNNIRSEEGFNDLLEEVKNNNKSKESLFDSGFGDQH